MSVDKFGRHESSLVREVLRGPPGEGFQLTRDGHYDLRGKRLCNISDPFEKDEAATLGTIRKLTLNCETNGNIFDAKNNKIIHVGHAEGDTYAVNKKFVLSEIRKLEKDMYHKFDKLQSEIVLFNSLYKEGIEKNTTGATAIYNTNEHIDNSIPLLTSNEPRQ